MTYRLKILSSLLILSLLLISKPVKAYEGVVMFALPFVGSIVGQSWRNHNAYDHDKEMAEFDYNIRNLNYIPIGGCKIFEQYDKNGAMSHGRACKQSDGSWKKDN